MRPSDRVHRRVHISGPAWRRVRPAFEILASVLGLAAGLVIAFAGYRLAKRLAALAGFLVGFVLGLAVGIVGGPVGMIVAAFVLGVLFALLFALAFRMVGAALGGSVAYAVAMMLGVGLLVTILLVLLGAIVGLVANKVMIVVATALTGGTLAAKSGLELLSDAGVHVPGKDEATLLWAALGLTLLGALVQWQAVRREA